MLHSQGPLQHGRDQSTWEITCFLTGVGCLLVLLGRWPGTANPDLPLQNLFYRLESLLSGDLFFPWRLGGDWAHSSLYLEVVLIAPLGLLLIRLHGDHDSFKGRQLNLHVPWRGHCSNPVQSRSAQKNVVGWRRVNNKVPDVGSAGGCTVSEDCPQLCVPLHFHLVSWEVVQTSKVRPQLVGKQLQLLKVDQNITSVELPWSTRTWCTFLPTVTIEITMGSLSCGTTWRQGRAWASGLTPELPLSSLP